MAVGRGWGCLGCRGGSSVAGLGSRLDDPVRARFLQSSSVFMFLQMSTNIDTSDILHLEHLIPGCCKDLQEEDPIHYLRPLSPSSPATWCRLVCTPAGVPSAPAGASPAMQVSLFVLLAGK